MPEGRRRERKVVSVLFCDLVGFTSQAEAMDPEDVEALLRPYHERVRTELERHGGTVEKFIGDAVVALFGAPTAHEDDPERAVRAALAIRDFGRESGLELRVGITTGEALVSLDARPSEGEGMASGDVVNTAARLQSAAPVNGVLVDETTYRATRLAIDYGAHDPLDAKGKSRPVEVREALQARSRPGVDVAHGARTGLVGREHELGVLLDALRRVLQARKSQLVTLVGVPGIGKSRLVYELSQSVESNPELITWRQGRCLAYGDGVTLWALGEIVKAQAGIHEQDRPEEASAKVRNSVAEVLQGESDAAWVESHVLALIGLSEESDLGGDRRNEAFAAWRRFFEAMADRRPFVLVVEDLHWADESLLDFLDELVDWVADVPLLVVGTARPELLERRPGWGGGKLNATTLAVEPLSDDETAVLIGELLDRPLLAADAQQALLERAGGNPLYAEQFSELFLEQGSAEALSLPETLQGIISARLDGLPADEKELLRDASVVGKVFWIGALRREPTEVGAALHSLSRKAFVRQQRRSSVEGESEFAFAHALVRDVAYAQIARADRAARHRRTAEWIESLGRPEDHAEMLAHHWRSALELAQAAGSETGGLAKRAADASRAAGDRAFALNAFATAAGHYGTALELDIDGDPSRPELLFRLGRSLFLAGDNGAAEALEQARDALVEAGDYGTAAECEAFLARGLWFSGREEEVSRHLRAAEALISKAQPSPSVARVLGWLGRQEMLAGELGSGLEHAEQALALAERFELVDLRVHALTTIGSAKAFLGDVTGRDDIERAIEIGRPANSTMVSGALNNLAVVIDLVDLDRVVQIQHEALHEAERFGDAPLIRFLRGNLIAPHWILGDWDDALATADRFIAECEESPHILESPSRIFRGYMRLARGHREHGLEDLRRGLELARERPADPQSMGPALIRSAWGHLQVGQAAEAHAEFAEALTHLRKDPYARPWALAEVAVDVGEGEATREILERLHPSPGRSAMIALTEERFAEAAEYYSEAGIRLFEAEARLRNAERLVAAGRQQDGAPDLEKALAFYRSVGATLFIARGEALLAATAQSESA
jgi:class 3 adenylate cyclase/tetratricopeptide (TPR) repeat protein